MPKAADTHTTPTPAPNVAPVPPTTSVDAPLLALAAEFRGASGSLGWAGRTEGGKTVIWPGLAPATPEILMLPI
jgi:hypothetical protein